MGKQTKHRTSAGIAGVVGAVVAFGITELVHGLYTPVPSILVSLAQRIVELTPGTIVTQGIELLGTADIPTLIASVLVGTVVAGSVVDDAAAGGSPSPARDRYQTSEPPTSTVRMLAHKNQRTCFTNSSAIKTGTSKD